MRVSRGGLLLIRTCLEGGTYPAYIDEKLRAFFSDLVYSCHLREGEGELKIAFLLEHKSSRPTYPHLQLVSNMSNIWQENIKQKFALKMVIPIIFYHGTKDYEYSFRVLFPCS